MKKLSFGLASALAILVTQLHVVPAADACGVKLIVKTPAPRQAAARSSRPSSVLLLGTPPNRLTRELAAKGHTVEVAPDAGSSKRGAYSLVLTDAKHADEARAKFGNEVVVVRSSDVTSDLRSVETYVARRPVKGDSERTVIAARAARKPIAAGPTPTDGGRRIIAARPTEETRPTAVTPTPPPTRTEPAVAAVVPKPEPVAVAPKPEPKPEPAPRPAAEPVAISATRPAPEETRPERPAKPVAVIKPQRTEIYFGLGKSGLTRAAQLARVVKWMNANPDVGVLVEGHADPTGTPEGNLALSQTRADAVREFLVEKGIDASRIEVQAYGDTKLKYGARDGRNRRVAIEPKQ